MDELNGRRVRAGILGLLAAALVWSGASGTARAGGGAENVFVVVNPRSWASQTIANHYIKLRGVPARNVFHVDWSVWVGHVAVADFRKYLLGPVLQEIEKRGLGHQIDYIAYSADFPYAAILNADLGDRKFDHLNPYGSINSLTYMWPLVMAGNPLYMAMEGNLYRQPPVVAGKESRSHAFRSWYGWGPNGAVVEAGGQHYMLSTFLGVTFGRGNSVPEIINYLERSAAADGKRWGGTIYFMYNTDVRSTHRRGQVGGAGDHFAAAAAAIEEQGVSAKIANGVLPNRAGDVAGLVMGYPKFDWSDSGSKLRPGAICDNLTSFGGVLDPTMDYQEVTPVQPQTPLTAFLRAGAAGACGTVVEPFLLTDKFPLPSLQVHYVRGCSLAESFYQSLYCPFQQLIVGDPLCQPWARIPQVTAEGVEAGAALKGTVSIKPRGETKAPASVDRFELFVDGLRVARCPAGDAFSLDTTTYADGHHELRIVGLEAGPIETQGRLILPVTFNNTGHRIAAATSPKQTVRLGAALKIAAKSPGAASLVVLHQGRELGKIAGESGALEVDSARLGQGPGQLQVRALDTAGKEYAVAAPLAIDVVPPLAMLPLRDPPSDLRPGVQLTLGTNRPQLIRDASSPGWFTSAGAQPNQAYRLEGYFNVPADDTYQFVAGFLGDLRIEVDGRELGNFKGEPFNFKYMPVRLGRGWHQVQVSGRTGDTAMFELGFGGQGVRPVDGRAFKCPAGR
ncbi:MAG: hypothetical protein U0836_22865 [Pirellulales bacterium]